MALSGRQAGKTCVSKPSALIARWYSSESTGSSVVQMVCTLAIFMIPRHEYSGVCNLALHSSQIPLAVEGLSKRSSLKKPSQLQMSPVVQRISQGIWNRFGPFLKLFRNRWHRRCSNARQLRWCAWPAIYSDRPPTKSQLYF